MALTKAEIEKAVYVKFPVIATEATCMTERSFRNKARRAYKQKLLQQNGYGKKPIR